MAYEQTVSPNGVSRLSTDPDQVFVPFSGDHSAMWWYRALSAWTPADGVFPTMFYTGDDPILLYDDALWVGWDNNKTQVNIWAKGVGSSLYTVSGGPMIDHHFAYVRSGTSNKLYVDGSEQIDWTQDLSSFPAPTSMYLGTDTDTLGWASHAIGYFREWDVALTPQEIADEMQNTAAVKTANIITETPFQGDFFDRYQVAAGTLGLTGEVPLRVIA